MIANNFYNGISVIISSLEQYYFQSYDDASKYIMRKLEKEPEIYFDFKKLKLAHFNGVWYERGDIIYNSKEKEIMDGHGTMYHIRKKSANGSVSVYLYAHELKGFIDEAFQKQYSGTVEITPINGLMLGGKFFKVNNIVDITKVD